MKNKLIELICEAVREHNCEAHCSCNCIKVEIITDLLLANGVTLQQWIPVSEPPKEDGAYFVLGRFGSMYLAHYWKDKHLWLKDGGRTYPTHWNAMPLPEPPKE